jgi:hypothetical protein
VYGGGGSPSSAALLEGSPLLSDGSAALVSCSTVVAALDLAATGNPGQNAGGGSGSASMALKFSEGADGGEKRDENDGGARSGGTEASSEGRVSRGSPS